MQKWLTGVRAEFISARICAQKIPKNPSSPRLRWRVSMYPFERHEVLAANQQG
jgi:hypothetical protein